MSRTERDALERGLTDLRWLVLGLLLRSGRSHLAQQAWNEMFCRHMLELR